MNDEMLSENYTVAVNQWGRCEIFKNKREKI